MRSKTACTRWSVTDSWTSPPRSARYRPIGSPRTRSISTRIVRSKQLSPRAPGLDAWVKTREPDPACAPANLSLDQHAFLELAAFVDPAAILSADDVPVSQAGIGLQHDGGWRF